MRRGCCVNDLQPERAPLPRQKGPLRLRIIAALQLRPYAGLPELVPNRTNLWSRQSGPSDSADKRTIRTEERLGAPKVSNNDAARNVANRWAYSYAATAALLFAFLIGGLAALVVGTVLSAVWAPLFFVGLIAGVVVGWKVNDRVYWHMVGDPE